MIDKRDTSHGIVIIPCPGTVTQSGKHWRAPGGGDRYLPQRYWTITDINKGEIRFWTAFKYQMGIFIMGSLLEGLLQMPCDHPRNVQGDDRCM